MNRYQGIAGAVLAGLAVTASAQDSSSVQDLDQRLKVLERQLEIQKEDADAKAKDAVQVSAGDKGFSLKSADGSYALNLKALVQADGRFFLADPAGQAINDGFLLRRVEPTFQVSLGKLVGATFTPNFVAGSNSSPGVAVSDLFVDVKFDPAYSFRIGRFKTPASGLENLQPSGAIRFLERGLPTSVAPNRDFGAQLQGALFNSTLNYAVGIFNGAADGRDAVPSDTDNRKEIAARIFAEPFKNSPGFFQGLGFGLAGSRGTKLGANTAVNGVSSVFQGYVTTGQQTFFTYAPSAAAGSTTTVSSTGLQTRLQPQAYFYRNSFGLLAEYSTSRQELQATDVAGAVTTVTGRNALTNRAYQAVVSYLVTGEEETYNQPVRPSQPYKVGGDGWGALEVAARYGALSIDSDAFPAFANPASAASRARDVGLAINWFPTVNLKLAANYDVTSFNCGAAAGGNRPVERALFIRAQVWY